MGADIDIFFAHVIEWVLTEKAKGNYWLVRVVGLFQFVEKCFENQYICT